MRVCKTCNNAMEAFRKALLLGQTEEAMSAYSTGCVNLDRPYTIYHGEVCGAGGFGSAGCCCWRLRCGGFALHARTRRRGLCEYSTWHHLLNMLLLLLVLQGFAHTVSLSGFLLNGYFVSSNT